MLCGFPIRAKPSASTAATLLQPHLPPSAAHRRRHPGLFRTLPAERQAKLRADEWTTPDGLRKSEIACRPDTASCVLGGDGAAMDGSKGHDAASWNC